jgi:hypothetical protein
VRFLALVALGWLAAPGVLAQTPDYFSPQPFELRGRADLELRQEWTEAFGLNGADDRGRARLLAGAEGRYRWLSFGVTGDLLYGSDDNVAGLGGPGQRTQRDNYRSRDARVDSAFVAAAPWSWLRLDAGRFPMPIGLTGLLWDPDLRPQGAALTLSARDMGAVRRLELTALGARGSHVFDDSETTMWTVAGTADLGLGERTALDLTGAFVTWQDVYDLEPALWRQNSYERGAGFLYDYDVLDVVARLRREGGVETELVVDVCRNLAADEGHTGVWLALVLDGVARGWPRLEYVYAWVDRDATLAAYPADDYLWTTGWEGHELKLAYRVGDHVVLRATGILSRYKDAPQEAFRDSWVGRARLELALRY